MGQIFTISKKNYHFRIELPHLPGPSIVVSICLFEHYVFITARKRSLGQGNIFRSVCQEFCSQRRVSAPGGCLLLGGAWSGGVCSREAVCLFLGGGCLVETPLDGYCCGRYASYWNAFLFDLFYYHPQTKLRKGNVFTPVYDSGQTPPMQTAPWADTPPPGNIFTSICHSVQGGVHGMHTPWACTSPLGTHSPQACTPFSGMHDPSPPNGYYEMRSMSGPYASYWNAFLFIIFFQIMYCVPLEAHVPTITRFSSSTGPSV